MDATYIIGIGGSGMKIGHYLKSLINVYNPNLLLTNENEAGKIKFRFIENDKYELKSVRRIIIGDYNKTITRNDIFEIPGFNPHRASLNIRRYKKSNKVSLSQNEKDVLKWLDDEVPFLDADYDTGLAGNRQLGRFALANNYNVLRSDMSDDISQLTNVANGNSGNISIYIISGISGGTGSSMFIDVSVILDDITGITGNQKKKAIFINTNFYLETKKRKGISETTPEYKNLQINTVALMKECEFFIRNLAKFPDLLAKYSARPSLLKNKSFVFTPYNKAIFFDNIMSNGQTIELNKFHQTVGNILFYTLTSESNTSFKQYIETNSFNRQQNAFSYAAIGYKMVKFPKEEFEEYFRARFFYEIFTEKFLNKKYDENRVKNEVLSFIKNKFSITSGIFQTKFYSNVMQSQTYKDLRRYETEAYFIDEDGDIVEKGTLTDLFNQHNTSLDDFNKQMDKLLKEEINNLGFYGEERDDSVSRQVKNKLEEWFYDLIVKYGYYSLIGITEEGASKRGAIGLLGESLKEQYLKLKQEYLQLSQQSFRNELDDLGKKIIVESEGRIGGQKNYKKVANVVSSYLTTLKKEREINFQRVIKKLQLRILYEIAAADDGTLLSGSPYDKIKIGKTLLKKIMEEKAIAIGTADHEENSLIKIFTSGYGEIKSVEKLYKQDLIKKFDELDKSIFNLYLPKRLLSYINSKRNDWKTGTVLHKLFKDNIKLQMNLDAIFPVDNLDMRDLLGDLGDNYTTELNEDLQNIMKILNDYFEANYIKNKNNAVSKFLNNNIAQAYQAAEQKDKERVQDKIRDIIYPIKASGMQKGTTDYVNISFNAAVGNFVVRTLGINKNNIIKNQNFGDDKIVLVKYADGNKFENIAGNDVNISVYQERDIPTFRPHLHKEWNNYRNGIEDALKGYVSSAVNTEDKPFGINWDTEELFLISTFVDMIKDKLKDLFVQDESEIELRSLIPAPPIYFDKESKRYIFVGSYVDDIEEDEKMKFALNGNVSPLKLCDKRKLEFKKSFNRLNENPNFISTMFAFLNFIDGSELKNDILSIWDDAKRKKEIKRSILDIQKRAQTLKRKIPKEDFDFASQYYSKLSELINKLR